MSARTRLGSIATALTAVAAAAACNGSVDSSSSTRAPTAPNSTVPPQTASDPTTTMPEPEAPTATDASSIEATPVAEVAADIAAATPDPVIPGARPAIDHMNADHADANILIARHLGGVASTSRASVRDIDRYGMTLYAATPEGLHVVRVPFGDRPRSGPDDIRGAVVALTHAARVREGS